MIPKEENNSFLLCLAKTKIEITPPQNVYNIFT
jgi:hypothetical protein